MLMGIYWRFQKLGIGADGERNGLIVELQLPPRQLTGAPIRTSCKKPDYGSSFGEAARRLVALCTAIAWVVDHIVLILM